MQRACSEQVLLVTGVLDRQLRAGPSPDVNKMTARALILPTLVF